MVWIVTSHWEMGEENTDLMGKGGSVNTSAFSYHL